MNNKTDFLEPVSQEYLGIPIRNQRQIVDQLMQQDIYNQETTVDPNGTYRQIEIVAIDPSTTITTGTNIVTATIPFDGKLVDIHAFVSTPSSSGVVDVTLSDGNSNIVGYLVVGANQNGTEESSGQKAIDPSYADFLRYDQIRVNVTGAGASAEGLVVQLYFIVNKFYY